MKWVTLLAAVLSLASARTASDKDDELAELYDKAESIIEKSQSLEITMEQARRNVQLLLRDMQAWAESFDVELSRETRTYSSPLKQNGKPLTADRCPLFFEEELHKLCPLDLARSEVWGGEVAFCRYYCE